MCAGQRSRREGNNQAPGKTANGRSRECAKRLPHGMSRENISGVSRSGAAANSPPVTGTAHRGSTPSKRAGSASAAPTMRCVIADAMALPEADRLPPQHAQSEPDREIYERD